MRLDEKLVRLRKEKGLTQLDLAEAVKVSRQAVSKWESGGGIPSTENLRGLSELYGVSIDYLLNEEMQEPEEGTAPMEKTGNSPEPVPVREGKRKVFIKWVVFALGLLALIVAIYIFVIDGNEGNFVPINDIPKKEVESEVGPGFDVNW